jgi:hypothetical protein
MNFAANAEAKPAKPAGPTITSAHALPQQHRMHFLDRPADIAERPRGCRNPPLLARPQCARPTLWAQIEGDFERRGHGMTATLAFIAAVACNSLAVVGCAPKCAYLFSIQLCVPTYSE